MSLMLKDYLHLQTNDNDADRALLPRQAKNALAKISALFTAIKNIPFSSSHDAKGVAFLPRSLSKRLNGRRFWAKNHQQQQQELPPRPLDERIARVRVRVRDIVRQRSFGDEGGEGILDFAVDGGSRFSPLKSPNFGANLNWGKSVGGVDFGCIVVEEKEEKELTTYYESESEEQLSPVSVMDFPSEKEDEDEGETAIVSNISSPTCFQSLANIDRSKLHLLHKTRQFDRLAELKAINLDHFLERLDDLYSPSNYEEPLDVEKGDDLELTAALRALDLLEELKAYNCSVVGPLHGNIEKLLFDFLMGGLSRHDETIGKWCSHLSQKFVLMPNCAAQVEEELMDRARCWIEEDTNDESEEALIREMERNGQWRRFDDEMERLGMNLEGIVLESLLEEVLVDLVCF